MGNPFDIDYNVLNEGRLTREELKTLERNFEKDRRGIQDKIFENADPEYYKHLQETNSIMIQYAKENSLSNRTKKALRGYVGRIARWVYGKDVL